MKIEIGKKYRSKNGNFTAEALCLDLKNKYPVSMRCLNDDGKEIVRQYTAEGKYYIDEESCYDLIEVPTYDHIKKGDVVLVWDNINKDIKQIGIFVGSENNGKVHVTSFLNSESYLAWDNCELYTGNK